MPNVAIHSMTAKQRAIARVLAADAKPHEKAAKKSAENRKALIASGENLGNPASSEVEYTQDEIEFSMALHQFRVRTGKRFPTNADTLRVLRGLGYAKMATV